MRWAYSAVSYSDIGLLYSTFCGFLLFAEVPDAWTVAGVLVILGAGLYVWRRERIRAAWTDLGTAKMTARPACATPDDRSSGAGQSAGPA